MGNEDFKLGDVWKGIQRTEIVDEFKQNNVYAKDKCKECFARFFCSGGCAANAYQFHGKILEAYDIGCELERKRVECALMMKAALADTVTAATPRKKTGSLYSDEACDELCEETCDETGNDKDA